eukprot:gene3928-66330_t
MFCRSRAARAAATGCAQPAGCWYGSGDPPGGGYGLPPWYGSGDPPAVTHRVGDMNHDGRLDWNEWCTWCDLYPNTLEVVYYRGRDTHDDEMIRRERDG